VTDERRHGPLRYAAWPLVCGLENSEFNSEFLQITARQGEVGRGVSMPCGEIPCAAEQRNQIGATGK
jgi:hypothetical protein